jgi:protein-S-isoprenylcysteine O-methyltransferase Ste14
MTTIRNAGFFHLWFTVLFTALLAVRIFFHIKARTWRREGVRSEGPVVPILRVVVALPLIIVTCVYLFKPGILRWASFSVPEPWRWAGGLLATVALGLLVWIQVELGTNFSGELRIRRDHHLVLSGPYRYVRHPMYGTFLLLCAGSLLMTANWFFGGIGLVVVLTVMLLRTGREERMLIETFGESYLQYAARTGRFLPRLRSKASHPRQA